MRVEMVEQLFLCPKHLDLVAGALVYEREEDLCVVYVCVCVCVCRLGCVREGGKRRRELELYAHIYTHIHIPAKRP